MIDTIKEYLVSLGFSVDRGSYDQATKAMDSFGKGASEVAMKMTKTFGEAAAAVAAFGVAATTGVAKFLDGLGNQEIRMEILSRQLWTTQQQAMAFNATLKAMGANLQELYLSPTLMKQYQQLHGVAMQLQTPGDYSQQIQQVQAIQLQIKQLRLEAYYSLQWIGYFFIKYMGGPISKVHDMLQSINKVIVKNMPTWTKRVAEVMVSFMQMGAYTVKAIGDLYNWLKKMADYMPGWVKIVGGALAIISVSNPFMLFVEGITAAMVLLDDFETYVRGGKAAFPRLWAWVVKTGNALNKLGIPQGFEDNIKALGNTLNDLGKSTVDLTSAIGDLYDAMQGKPAQGIIGTFQLIANIVSGIQKSLMTVAEEVSGFLTINADIMKGKFGAAAIELGKMITGWNLVQAGIIPQKDAPGVIVSNRSKKLPQYYGVNHPNYFNPNNAMPSSTGTVAKPGANGYPWTKKPTTTHYSYAYPKVSHYINNHSNTNASKTFHAPITVNQTIHTSGANGSTMGKALAQGIRPGLLSIFRGLS